MKRIHLPHKNLTESPALHVFVKGYRGRAIFNEPADYLLYLALLKQFLRLQQALDAHEPRSLAVQVHGFSLQPRTIQLLVTDVTHQQELTKLMQAIHIAYTRYHCKKYRHTAILFSDVYKSTTIDSNRDKHQLLNAMHTIRGNHWYQDSRGFYQPGRQVGWITPLQAENHPKTRQNKISHTLAVDK